MAVIADLNLNLRHLVAAKLVVLINNDLWLYPFDVSVRFKFQE